MILAKKVTNIKVVEPIKLYNFYFGHFFIRQSGSNIVHKSYISLLLFTTTMSDEQMSKIKVVALGKL